MKKIYVLVILLALTFGCKTAHDNASSEVMFSKGNTSKVELPSWNDSKSKSEIMAFVQKITNQNSPDFVPVIDRIATFDNDGTLWSEQPVYFQIAFAFDKVKMMVAENPELTKDPFLNAVANNDMETVMQSGEAGLGKLIMMSHTGMTTDVFDSSVSSWAKTAKHPKTGKLYTEMVFQPMLELINYLKANDFTVFIVSGGGSDFMRPWAETVYGISKDNIIGTTMKLEYEMVNNEPKLKILPELGFNDDKEGKPMAIHQYIGRKPIAAFGNSDGDLQMLQWTDSNSYSSLQVYVHHTDANREWAYDRESHIGKLDKGLNEATTKNWTVINMKTDWSVIFPFEMSKN